MSSLVKALYVAYLTHNTFEEQLKINCHHLLDFLSSEDTEASLIYPQSPEDSSGRGIEMDILQKYCVRVYM